MAECKLNNDHGNDPYDSEDSPMIKVTRNIKGKSRLGRRGTSFPTAFKPIDFKEPHNQDEVSQNSYPGCRPRLNFSDNKNVHAPASDGCINFLQLAEAATHPRETSKDVGGSANELPNRSPPTNPSASSTDFNTVIEYQKTRHKVAERKFENGNNAQYLYPNSEYIQNKENIVNGVIPAQGTPFVCYPQSKERTPIYKQIVQNRSTPFNAKCSFPVTIPENDILRSSNISTPISNIGYGSAVNVNVVNEEQRFQFKNPLVVTTPLETSRRCCINIHGVPYQVLSELGRGGSSKVYQALHPETHKLLAIKKVDLSGLEDLVSEAYLNEVQLLSTLQHCEHVIKMFDSQVVMKGEKRLLYVVMEKGDTDLSKLIRNIKRTAKVSLSMVAYYWNEMLTAVEEIHKQGIIHNDLKPANFLLVSGRLKLIDFGIASRILGDMTSVHREHATGTWNYMSPEALICTGGANGSKLYYKVTPRTDVWSLGCILYSLVYGETPFHQIPELLPKMQAITDPNVKISFPEDKHVPPTLMNALRGCLQKDPKKRPTVSQLLNDSNQASENL